MSQLVHSDGAMDFIVRPSITVKTLVRKESVNTKALMVLIVSQELADSERQKDVLVRISLSVKMMRWAL